MDIEAEKGGFLYSENLIRYFFAQSYCYNKKVLVIGCGLGYGTKIACKYAHTVVGIDVDKNSIELAKKRYSDDKTKFVCTSIEDYRTNQKFDVILAFEVLEHLDSPQKTVRWVKQHLNPKGFFLSSVPNTTNPEINKFDVSNPFHKQHFNKFNFSKLVHTQNWNVQLLGQNLTQCYLNRVSKHLKQSKSNKWPISKLEDWEISEYIPEKSHSLFCVCYNKKWPLKLALVSDEFARFTGGGIGTYSEALVEAISARGVRVHLITRQPETNYTPVDYPNTKIMFNSASYRLMKLLKYLFIPRFISYRISYNFKVFLKLRKLQSQGSINIIETPEWQYEGIFYSITRGKIPMVIRSHSPIFLLDQHSRYYNPKIKLLAEKLYMRINSNIVFPTAKFEEDVKTYVNLNSKNTRVIPNFLPKSFIKPLVKPEFNDGKIRVLFVGRIDYLKGADSFVLSMRSILRKYPELSLTLVGPDTPTSPTRKSLVKFLRRRIPKDIASRIEFRGKMSRDELPKLYNEHDICVIPSRYESFSYICIEAQWYNCLVIANAVGGLQNLVQNRVNGISINTFNHKELQQSFDWLMSNKSQIRRIAKAGKLGVMERFSEDKVVEQQLELYSHILKQTRRRRKNGTK